ncbi:MAG: hypothetical protein IIV73_01430, partial [Bacteroidaceae bacterium]|nr:hypothetical protein [Bacteroidaceae bacterium]
MNSRRIKNRSKKNSSRSNNNSNSTKKGHHIEILGGFHRCGKNHDIDRQESDALGEEDPAKTADQRRYKYVADVGPNEIVMHIQRNIQFNEEDDHKKGCVSNASFFH